MNELDQTLSAAEFDEWRLYAMLEPFGEWAAHYRAAKIASTVFNMNRGKDTEPRTVADFMPNFDAPPRPAAMAVADVRAAFMAWMPPK